MSYRNRAIIDAIRSVAFGSIGAAYTAVGDIVDEPTRMIYVYNGTDKSVLISDDGSSDKFIVPAGGFILLDLTTNKVRDDGFFLAENRYWYVKHAGSAPSSGSVYITLIHS